MGAGFCIAEIATPVPRTGNHARIPAAVAAFAATVIFETPDAKAVVCIKGAVRAGCVAAGGSAVVRRPAMSW